MVTLMVHASNLCTDSCLIYNILSCVVDDITNRLRLKINLVFLSVGNVSCDTSIIYCQQNNITYNAVDSTQTNLVEAVSEVSLVDTVLLAIPYTVNIDADETTRLADAVLRTRGKVVMLHNYRDTNRDNMKSNIVYYNM